MTRSATIAAMLVAIPIAIAGCGGGSSGGGGYSQGGGSSSAPTTGGPVTVKLSTTKLGRILTDGKGRTLYLFEKDKGTRSSCFGSCASGWPPLMAKGTPKLGGGLTASKLGTTTRAGGGMQVTYGGHPLYYYAGDKAPGQTAGEGLDAFGAEWYALSAAGKKVENESS